MQDVERARHYFEFLVSSFVEANISEFHGIDIIVWRPKFRDNILSTVFTSFEKKRLDMHIGEGIAGYVAKFLEPRSIHFDNSVETAHPIIVEERGWRYAKIWPEFIDETLVGVVGLYSRVPINLPENVADQFTKICCSSLWLYDLAIEAELREKGLEKTLLSIEISKVAEDRFHDIKEMIFVATETMKAIRLTAVEKAPQLKSSFESLGQSLKNARDLTQRFIEEAKNPDALRIETLDFSELVKRAASDFNSLIRERNRSHHRKIDLRYPVELQEIIIDGDPERLHRAVRNILLNAEWWVIRTNNEICRIDIDLSVEHSNAVLKIRDTGPGIIDKKKALEKGYSLRPGGTGLGLAIASRILKLHGGDIRLESNVPNWTAVYMSIPLKKRK
jgi:hypothetical protein